ncbi:MAG TPA: hypothetical protein VGF99_18480, partial [Myxococcota bacterium]
MKRLLCAAVLFAAVVDARPARACDGLDDWPQLFEAPLPFEDARVPANVSLRLGQFFAPNNLAAFLTGPDGIEQPATIARDDYSDVVEHGDFAPGAWRLRLAGGDEERIVSFTVDENRDEGQPSPPRFSHSSAPPAFFECGGLSARVAEQFDYAGTTDGDGDDADDDIAWFVVGGQIRAVVDGAASISFYEGIDDPDVVVI